MTVLLSSLTFVLERRINYPLAEVEAALRGRVVDDLSIDVEGGALLVSQAFRPEPDPWYPTSRALGRLATRRGHLVARIELMLAPWSDDATRLEIRPVARRPQHWNGRRLRRYFDLAHEGADAFLVLANEGCGALAQLPALSAR